jgi:tRNA U34 5-methylaminomethyl-2-thiouridine-forming methyltransferase MnmC
MTREVKIITTEDGSHSLFVPELNETYHSFHGAYRESVHVFMLYGLEAWFMRNPDRFPIRIFEVGFGTGLNAWLSMVWAEQYKVPVLYHSLEPFPLEKEVYSQLNYTQVDPSISEYALYFNMLHQAPWNEGAVLSEYFNMKKDIATLEKAILFPADVVLFDAFAPSKQPELWTKEVIAKVVDTMNPGGVFVTYCAQGQLKRNLKELGLEVETLPGPPGKKEMTRAWRLQ